MIRCVTILSLLLAAAISMGEDPRPPLDVPAKIAIPAGYTKVASFEAKGDQLYKAVKGKGGELKWDFVAPKADLYDDKGKKAGTHYTGPTWEANDGSKLTRDKKMKMKSAESADPKTDVPLLLLEVKSAKGKAGLLSEVGYVQRLNTRGGAAPKEAPKDLESTIAVPYTATYVFFAKKD